MSMFHVSHVLKINKLMGKKADSEPAGFVYLFNKELKNRSGDSFTGRVEERMLWRTKADLRATFYVPVELIENINLSSKCVSNKKINKSCSYVLILDKIKTNKQTYFYLVKLSKAECRK